MHLPMCECGERLTICMVCMGLVCEGCGFFHRTPACRCKEKEEVNVEQSVRGTSEPDHEEVMSMEKPTRCKCGYILPVAVCFRCMEGLCPVCGFVNEKTFAICRTCVIELEYKAELARN